MADTIGTLARIDHKNFVEMQYLASKLNTNVDEVINLALESVNWTVDDNIKHSVVIHQKHKSEPTLKSQESEGASE